MGGEMPGKQRILSIVLDRNGHRRRVSGVWELSPPNIYGQIFDCLLCFDSHNAISPELKIHLFMYYSWI